MQKKLTFALLIAILISTSFSIKRTIYVVGVSEGKNGYEGILANLTVEVKEGSGRVFSYTMPLTKIDTQASARIAKEVSCEILNLNCSKYDFYYIIKAPSPIIGGPSAGAAMTIATLACLLNVSLKNDTVITGTINPDWSIGLVGGIPYKMEAASKVAKNFIIPVGIEEEDGINLKEEAEELGLNLYKAFDIRDAFKIFTGYEIKEKKVEAKVNLSLYKKAMKEVYLSFYSTINKSKADNETLELIEKAENLSKEGKYYSATSFLVRAKNRIYKQFLEDNYEKLNDYIESLDNSINEIEEKIENAKIDSIFDVDALVIAISRLYDAKESLREAGEEVITSEKIKKVAYAYVRYETVKAWLSMLNFFKGNYSVNFSESKLENLAAEKLQEAYTTISYATAITGYDQFDIEKASEAFDEGEYVYSIFESVKAKAIANLFIALALTKEEDYNKQEELLKEIANDSIKLVESQGIIPILGLSYLEYSETFNETTGRLIFLSYSKEFSKLSLEIAKELNKNITIKSNFEIEKVSKSINIEKIIKVVILPIISFITGLFLGILIKRPKVGNRIKKKTAKKLRKVTKPKRKTKRILRK